MEKYFNIVSIISSLVGGFICKHLGGWDMLLCCIITLVVLDYLTGVLKAIYNKQLSSEIGFRGIIKKVFIFIVIAVAYEIQKVIGDSIALREMTLMFFIANEAISLLENVSEYIPIPEKLKGMLVQLRDGK
ncbi:phage holin family protein [Intestinibacter sp.]|uniref:phage holin family protein n=1 Tax=Intestinibacter sp. TaxID=1965304 RepID=UPI00307D793C